MRELYVALTYIDTIEVPEDWSDDKIDEYIRYMAPESLLIGNLNDVDWGDVNYG